MLFRIMRRRLLWVVLLIGALLVPQLTYTLAPLSLVPRFDVASAPGPDPSSPFGVAGAMRWPDWGTFGAPADAVLQTGGAWTREDFAWGLIEPSENSWSWTATDRIVGNLHSRGINILGIISYSAKWATPTRDDDGQASPVSFYPPDLTKYYSFVKTLVTHYKGLVRHWEVWNEPDSALFWRPSPDARRYAELLKTAYRAVKDADPSARVLTGGMAGNAVPFLEQVLAAGAGNSFDILSLHPYAVPSDPAKARIESQPEVHKIVEVELTKYKAMLQRHGIDRPMWITEMGWPAHGWQLDDSAQADYLAQAYAQVLASGLVERVFWYAMKDESSAPDQSWGLVAWGQGNKDLSQRRPSFAAYATSVKMLSGAIGAGRTSLGPWRTVLDFEQPISWVRRDSPSGSFASTGEVKHLGGASGKMQYSLDAPNRSVDFAPPQPIAIGGRPTRIGMWVRGDASGDYLSVWLRDRDGELFKVRLGAVTAPTETEPWRYYEASIAGYYFPYEMAPGNPSNGVVDYPISFAGFRLENIPDEPAGSGTIYVDDLQVFDGPDASAVRFQRLDGQVVDVLWSVNPVTVSLPTRSSQVVVTDRDGATKGVAVANGAATLQVSSSPIYVVHHATDWTPTVRAAGLGPSGVQGLVGGPPVCAAAPRATPASLPGNVYFAETGHNLKGVFKRYWDAHGGLAVLGFPITEEFVAPSTDGKAYTQQYFERARLEYHPEAAPPNDVQVGLLGVWLTNGRNFAKAPPSQAPGAAFFPQTGHNLALFRDWWTRSGGLSTFGYPVSEEIQERNAADGKTYTVQYFERNRLEYHPENKGTANEVMLGLLGSEYVAQQKCK